MWLFFHLVHVRTFGDILGWRQNQRNVYFEKCSYLTFFSPIWSSCWKQPYIYWFHVLFVDCCTFWKHFFFLEEKKDDTQRMKHILKDVLFITYIDKIIGGYWTFIQVNFEWMNEFWWIRCRLPITHLYALRSYFEIDHTVGLLEALTDAVTRTTNTIFCCTCWMLFMFCNLMSTFKDSGHWKQTSIVELSL